VIAIALAIAHSRGYLFARSNQALYFLEPLRRAHPELFRNDWLVGTDIHHHVFSAAAAWLFRWDDDGTTAVAIAHVVVIVAVIVAVYLLVRAVAGGRAFVAFALVVGWFAVNGERSLAGSVLWAGYLQPSLVAAAGWVVALALYARGRPLATGIVLAASGAFHVNFLILGIAAFAVAELVVARVAITRRLALLVAPQLVVLVAVAPELVPSASAHEPELALWVLVKFFAPHHYDPANVAVGLVGVVMWVCLAWLVAPIAAARACAPAMRRLVTWCVVAGAMCAIVLALALVPPLLPITRLYVWRLGPFAQLAAQVVTMFAVVATIEDPTRWRAQPTWRTSGAAALGAITAVVAPFARSGEGRDALVAVALCIIAALFVARARRVLPMIAAAACLVIALGARWRALVHPQTGVVSDGAELDALYAWAREHTPVDAVFLVNPDLGRFRLLARRAIVVDFKSQPLAPDDLVAWYRRLADVSGVVHPDSFDDVRVGWRTARIDELLARARAVGADYVAVDHDVDSVRGTAVYASPHYAMLAVHPAAR
jgi:hypothetical protein